MLSLGEVMKDAKLSHFVLQNMDFKFRIKAGTRPSGSGNRNNARRRPDSVPPAKITVDTDDSDAFRKISEGFEKSPKSLYNATPQVKAGREGQFTATIELQMRTDKLKDF